MAMLNSDGSVGGSGGGNNSNSGGNIELTGRNSMNENTPLNRRTSLNTRSGRVEDVIMVHPTLNRLACLLQPYFNKFDADGSGFLDIDELGKI